jgi:hypothetical protein
VVEVTSKKDLTKDLFTACKIINKFWWELVDKNGTYRLNLEIINKLIKDWYIFFRKDNKKSKIIDFTFNKSKRGRKKKNIKK